MKSLLLALAATLFALAVSETALRLLDQSYYWAVAKRPDPLLGWRSAPDTAAWQRAEGAALVTTNRLGLRDRDHPLHKTPGRYRIAVLGDSFTEAVQVPIEQTWWRVMEGALNDGGCAVGPSAEVLNFALSGYSTAQSLLMWRHLASRFEPDAVVLALFVGNDLNENTPLLDHDPLRPYLTPSLSPSLAPSLGPYLEPHGEAGGQALILDDRFKTSASYRFKTSLLGRTVDALMPSSRVLQTLVQVRHRWLAGRAGGQQTSRGAAQGEAGEPVEPGVDNAIYRRPVEAAWRSAWAATEAMLAAFADEIRALGAEPLLLIIGSGAQVHPNAEARARFARRIGVDDLGYPVRRLLDAAAAARLPVLNLPAIMVAEAKERSVVLHGFAGGLPGFGHWNPEGHRLAGAAAADALCVLRRGGWHPR